MLQIMKKSRLCCDHAAHADVARHPVHPGRHPRLRTPRRATYNDSDPAAQAPAASSSVSRCPVRNRYAEGSHAPLASAPANPPRNPPGGAAWANQATAHPQPDADIGPELRQRSPRRCRRRHVPDPTRFRACYVPEQAHSQSQAARSLRRGHLDLKKGKKLTSRTRLDSAATFCSRLHRVTSAEARSRIKIPPVLKPCGPRAASACRDVSDDGDAEIGLLAVLPRSLRIVL